MARVYKKKRVRRINLLILSIHKFIKRFVKQGKCDYIYLQVLLGFILAKTMLRISLKKMGDDLLELLRPAMGLRPLFASGIIYNIPAILNIRKEERLAIFWFYKGILNRTEREFSQRVFYEIIDIFHKKGESLNLRTVLYDQIILNRVLVERFRRRLK
jgi:ribosomal protein S7